jgi:hypothetical protein
MAHRLVTSAAKKGKGKRHVRHMHIEKAENGYSAETHFQNGDGEKEMGYMEPERHVFQNPKELASHVTSTFGDGMAKDADEGKKKPAATADEADGDEEDDDEEDED